MIHCTHCGNVVAAGTRNCPRCDSAIPNNSVTVDLNADERPHPSAENMVSDTLPVNDQGVAGKSYCRHCGHPVKPDAFGCMNCGLSPLKGKNFCQQCGAASHPEAVVCVSCGIRFEDYVVTSSPSSAPASTSALPASSTENEYFRRGSFWGAALVVLGFFLPWIDFFIGISGYKIASAEFPIEMSITPRLLYLMPVSAGIFLYLLVSNRAQNAGFLKWVPLVVFLIFIISLIIDVSEKGGRYFSDDMFEDFSANTLFKILGAGFYFTVIGAIMMSCYKRTSPPAGK